MFNIHSLTIKNVRAIEHLHLDELPESGVIVIHGPNEEGKSTILDALHLVLTEKHTAGGKKIKIFQPVNRDVAPEVTLHATVGPVTFTIYKRWLKRREAVLEVTAPTHAQYTGGDADDKLNEILSEYLDMDLLETFFLRQEDQGAAIQAAGIPALSSALSGAQDDAGETVDVADDDELMKAVYEEYLEYFTKGGQPNAHYKGAITRAEEAAEELTRAETELTSLQHYVDQMAASETDLAESQTALPAAEVSLAEAQEAWEKAREAKKKLDHAVEHENIARRDVEAALNAQKERADRAQDLADLDEKIEAYAPLLSEAEDKAQAEMDTVHALQGKGDKARKERSEAHEVLKDAKAALERARNAERLAEITHVLTTVAEADARLEELRVQRPTIRITEAHLAELSEANQERSIATALRDSVVPKLEVQADPATTIQVDGEDLHVDEEIHVVDLVEGTTLTVGNLVATYRGGGTTVQDATVRVERAEAALSELLEEVGCMSIEEAREKKDHATALDAAIQDAQRDRDAALGARDAGELKAEKARLEREQQEVPEEADADVEKLESTVRDLEDQRDDLDAQIDRIEKEMEPYREKAAETRLVEIKATVASLQDNRESAAAKLAQMEEDVPAADLAQRVSHAEAVQEQAQAAVAEAEAAVAAANPDLQEEMVNTAQARVTALKDRSVQASHTIATLKGYIEQAAGAAETVEKARAEAEQKERYRNNLDDRAQAAQKLWTVLQKHRQAARARYAQPFADELTSLASTVFGPDVSFELTENLEVDTRTVSGVTVPLDSLSGGAKEQMAILTRFAIAGLVGKNGGNEDISVPIVVDDALGATDAQRLERMNALFTRVGKNTQVIVLTCFPQRYDWVRGKTEYSMGQLKAPANT